MAEHTGKYVAYYRVSTQRQGASGLGLDAQRQAVTDYLNGGAWSLEHEFTEIESGKRAGKNPVLRDALAYCREHGCKLVVAKLDRLGRSVSFTSALMESGVEFVAVDNPHATRFTIHILSAVAELEREQISTRTKAALKAAKARGVQLGNPNIGEERKADAAQRVERLRRLFDAMKDEGLSQHKMVDRLRADKVPLPSGKDGKWYVVQVQRTLQRLDL